MADVLLDSTVFDDLRKGDSEALQLVESIVDGKINAAIAPITVCELWHRSEIDRRTEIGFLSVLRFVEEVPLDLDAARQAGLWLANLPTEERPRNHLRELVYVAPVAALSQQLHIPVCTRDTELFELFGAQTTAYR